MASLGNYGPCWSCGSGDGRSFRFPSANPKEEQGYLCASCSRKVGLYPGQEFRAPTARELALRLMGPNAWDDLVCHDCGLTWYAVRLTGTLGCPACHQVFRQALKAHLRVSGPVDPELPLLREQLAQALAAELFEEAAILRDRIRSRGALP